MGFDGGALVLVVVCYVMMIWIAVLYRRTFCFRKSKRASRAQFRRHCDYYSRFWMGNEWKTEIIANTIRFYVEKCGRGRAKETAIGYVMPTTMIEIIILNCGGEFN